MSDDKMKGDMDFKNHSGANSTTSPLQAKPTSGLVSLIDSYSPPFLLLFVSMHANPIMLLFSIEAKLCPQVYISRAYKSCVCCQI